MNITIKRVVYDSDASEPVGDFIAEEPGPHSVYGTLYRTPRSGRFFIVGGGGFLSRFKSREMILPVTEGEARLIRNTLIKRTRLRREREGKA